MLRKRKARKTGWGWIGAQWPVPTVPPWRVRMSMATCQVAQDSPIHARYPRVTNSFPFYSPEQSPGLDGDVS